MRKLIAQAKVIAEFRPLTDESAAKDKANIEFFESLIGMPVQKGKPVQKRRKKK